MQPVFGGFGTAKSEIFVNSVKRHISNVKKSRLGHCLPTSVNDRVVLPFLKGFIFTKSAKFRKN